ncbi:hypothetical protein DY000_02029251 [Brassica cretica]|uniref:Dirigent protein n=1 Tax=Brassica cretica TaxID=69181 RepID=A0ABQ7ALX3_BRACR|nr:hypothetical protein DY000_02052615 [Brassica cretica]KAF3578373.1 hypothetical protein DY000_02029251 [Brassica cretica]
MAKLIIFLAVQIFLLTIVSSTGDDGENFARTIDRKLLATDYKLYLFRRNQYDRQRLDGESYEELHVTRPGPRVYAGAAQKELGFLMAMNFAFKTGKYNGSTITIFGRNTAMSEVREMPIVGGSGIFRFARLCRGSNKVG